MGQKKVSLIVRYPHFEMHTRVVHLGWEVLFREVSSVQECPHRERGRERFHCKCSCDGECCMYAMQAGLQFGQKAQYVHVCRWFDQVLNLCVYVMWKVRIENPRMACCTYYVCVYVCTLWYYTIPLPAETV